MPGEPGAPQKTPSFLGNLSKPLETMYVRTSDPIDTRMGWIEGELAESPTQLRSPNPSNILTKLSNAMESQQRRHEEQEQRREQELLLLEQQQ